MLIRIKQTRKRPLPGGGFRYGTDVDMTPQGSTEKRIYQFRPQDAKSPEVNHVCDVTDRDDVARFLAIPQGYEIHDSVLAKKPSPGPARQPEPEPDTETAKPPAGTTPAGEDTRTQKQLLAAVFEKTGKKPSPATARKKLLALLA